MAFDFNVSFANSNTIQEYVSRIFGESLNLSTSELLFLLILSLIIGFIALTLRYTLNPKNEKEYKLWKEEHWPTKIFLSLTIGALSFFFISIFGEFLVSVRFLLTGEIISKSLIFGEGLIGAILLAIILATGFMYVCFERGYTHYRDIKKFIIFGLVSPIILAPLSVSFILFRELLVFEGILFLFISMLILAPFVIPLIKPSSLVNLKSRKRK